MLELQEQGKPVYKAKSVSFTSLCDMYGASANPLKDQVIFCLIQIKIKFLLTHAISVCAFRTLIINSILDLDNERSKIVTFWVSLFEAFGFSLP